MKFISNTALLKIQISDAIRHEDPVTKVLTKFVPAKKAVFKGKIYETKNKSTIHRLLMILKVCEVKRLPTSFFVHPEDQAEAAEIMATLNPDEEEDGVTYIAPQADSEKEALMKRVAALEAELAEKKTKPPAKKTGKKTKAEVVTPEMANAAQ